MMKRCAILFVLLLCAVTGFADTASAGAELRLNTLIDDGLYRNFGAITAESFDLNAEQKYRLYAQHESDPMLPFLVNFLVGFGIGSFVQSDLSGGFLGAGLDLGGIAFVTIGYLMLLSEWMVYFPDYDPYAWPSEMPTAALSISLAGVGMLAFSRIHQLIRPFTYAQRYNEDLRRGLNM